MDIMEIEVKLFLLYNAYDISILFVLVIIKFSRWFLSGSCSKDLIIEFVENRI